MSDDELLSEIRRWQADDEQGYDTAINLLCRAAETIEAQQQTIDLLRRAMHADAERLRHAADRVRVTYVGCDTADALADRIEELNRRLQSRGDA